MGSTTIVSRNQIGYLRLLKDQYVLLKDAVDGFYAGNEAKANDASIRIRTLVHNTDRGSTALLSFVAANYMELPIYHRAKETFRPKAVFVLKQPIQLSADGTSKFIPTTLATQITGLFRSSNGGRKII